MNTSLPAHKRLRVETRDKESMKVSLALYREESKKIFALLRRYSEIVEKASCDEAFIDVTEVVNNTYIKNNRQVDNDWKGAHFFGKKEVFIPETDLDKKLMIANGIAYQMREAIFNELGYRASCGISHNKTLAKLASGQNKPNAQTVVPIRYIKDGLVSVRIKDIRFCGGKVGEVFKSNGIQTIGEV